MVLGGGLDILTALDNAKLVSNGGVPLARCALVLMIAFIGDAAAQVGSGGAGIRSGEFQVLTDQGGGAESSSLPDSRGGNAMRRQVEPKVDAARSLEGALPALLSTQAMGTKKRLDADLTESSSRAERRVAEQNAALSEYFAAKVALESKLRNEMLADLKRFESGVAEEVQAGLLKRLKERQADIMSGVAKFAKQKNEEINARILAFEAQVRSEGAAAIALAEDRARLSLLEEQQEVEASQRKDAERRIREREAFLKRQFASRMAEGEKQLVAKMQRGERLNVAARDDDTANVAAAPTKEADRSSSVVAAASSVSPAEKTATERWDATAFDQSVRGLLARWSGKAGWSLAWEAEVDYPIASAATYYGKFEQVVSDLVTALPVGKSKILVKFYPENRVVRIYQQGAQR